MKLVPANDPRVMVSYTVPSALANVYIASLNREAANNTPQEMAGIIAAMVASCAFMMLSANKPETVKEVFGLLVDDAHKQYEARKRLLAARETKPDEE